MRRILCSTGAFIGRPNGRDYRLIKKVADQLECDGFEFMMYEDWYEKIDEIVSFFSDLSKPFPSFHVDKNVGDLVSRNEAGDSELALLAFEKNCELAQKLGSEKLILHLWSGLSSDKDLPHNIAMYKQLREIAQRFGLLLTIENVVCNCNDPMTDLKAVMKEYPDVSITFDTKMAEFHGQLLEICKTENKSIWDRVVHLHVNDYKGGLKDWTALKTLHIGDGQIDFDSFFAFVREAGYAGDITIESTSFDKTGIIDTEKMNRSIRKVAKYLAV
ncbi:MAG: sugar phosphate isomerase/epimerase [Lachnospiraceae bacterium]|nr:sugar phosphate isomerase/epimerase [Lachnospiraceae bacterium]